MHKDQNNSKYTDAFWGIGFGAFYGSNPIISNQWGHHLDLPISQSLKRPVSIATSNLKMDENGITISCWSCSCNTHTHTDPVEDARHLSTPTCSRPSRCSVARSAPNSEGAPGCLWRSVTMGSSEASLKFKTHWIDLTKQERGGRFPISPNKSLKQRA